MKGQQSEPSVIEIRQRAREAWESAIAAGVRVDVYAVVDQVIEENPDAYHMACCYLGRHELAREMKKLARVAMTEEETVSGYEGLPRVLAIRQPAGEYAYLSFWKAQWPDLLAALAERSDHMGRVGRRVDQLKGFMNDSRGKMEGTENAVEDVYDRPV